MLTSQPENAEFDSQFRRRINPKTFRMDGDCLALEVNATGQWNLTLKTEVS